MGFVSDSISGGRRLETGSDACIVGFLSQQAIVGEERKSARPFVFFEIENLQNRVCEGILSAFPSAELI